MATNQDTAAGDSMLARDDAVALATAGEFAGLLFLCLLIHAIALRFVFPGFYEPTLFEHSDFYAPVNLRYSGHDIPWMLSWGRPIGMLFLYGVGWLGTIGSLWVTLGVIFSNIILVAMIVRRVCGITLDWWFILAFALFSYCLFSHPYFFTMAAHDALAQLSFFLLAIGFAILLASRALNAITLTGLFLLMVLGFSSKETFALSVIWLLGCVGLARGQRGPVAAAALSSLGIVAFLLAFTYALHVKSGFVSDSGDVAGTYHHSYDLLNMLGQFADYVMFGTPMFALLLLVAVYLCLLVLLPTRFRIVVVALIFAGLAAIVPNTTLPNHFYPGYSWNMGYFLFAPLLLLPLIRRRIDPRAANLVGLVLGGMLIVGLPYFWRPGYAANDWTLQSAAIQRNLRHSLDVLSQSAALGLDHRRVLVTGLNGLFSPFDQGGAIREWVGNSDAQFDVVVYTPKEPTTAFVRFLMPNDIRIDGYTDIWAFATDGTGREVTAHSNFPNLDFLGAREMILYPNIVGALGLSHYAPRDVSPDASQLLQCGIKLNEYHAYELAIAAFDRSIAQQAENPYAFFYEALAYQALGRRDEALKSARQAIATDAEATPNPYFAKLAQSLQPETPRDH